MPPVPMGMVPGVLVPMPVPPGPLDTATLRARGAEAFRELGTFGEPPATKETALSPVADILAVAADGDVMPQKSTYFYPKALTGLVINPHEW